MREAEAAALLRTTLREMAADLRLPFNVQDAAAMCPDDLVAALRHGGELAVMIDDAITAAEAAREKIRETLTTVLVETGAPSIRLAHHTLSITAPKPGVTITDPDALPTTLLRQPPPTPDKTAIGDLLAKGHPVPGAVLRNGQPALRITANRSRT